MSRLGETVCNPTCPVGIWFLFCLLQGRAPDGGQRLGLFKVHYELSGSIEDMLSGHKRFHRLG